VDFWKNHLGYTHKYYIRARSFADQAGLSGPILWTELVHCQSVNGVPLSVQTIRECINKHLVPQIRLLSREAVLVALGGEAYKILAYRFNKRLVLGVPHPTGSYGQWHRLMHNGKLLDTAKHEVAEILEAPEPVARIFQCIGTHCRFR
jgi:uracil-DNA glycosylase